MKPIDLNPRDLEIIKAILRKHVPEYEVRAFGSRVKWTARDTSDLDLVIMSDKPVPLSRLAEVREALSESGLQVSVDLVDWAATDSSFRRIIEQQFAVIQSVIGVDDRNDWTETPFPDVIDFQEGPGILAKDFRETGVPLIRLSGLERGVSVLEGCNYLDPEMVKARWAHFAVQQGDILLSTSASLGRIAVVGPEAIGAIPYTGIIRMRPRDDRVYAQFIRYLLEGPDFQRQVEMMGVGSVIRHFGPMHLRQMYVLVPPIIEQRAIADVLGALDEKTELNRRETETLEAMARALFKSWFVDFDPVRAKAEGRDTGLPKAIFDLFPDSFEDSELGEIPKGWSSKGLDEIATYLNGLALQKYPPEGDSWLPVIKIAQLNAGHTVGADRASASIPSKYVIKDGDVLFSWSGSLELVLWCGGSGALNQHLFKVASDEYPKWFYFLWTERHLPEFRNIAADKATTMGHIQRHHIHSAKAAVPPAPHLKQMDRYFAPIFENLIQKRRISRTLSSIRDALLPKLISGEIRVKGAERLVSEHV